MVKVNESFTSIIGSVIRYPFERIHRHRLENLAEQAQAEYDIEVLQDAAKLARPDDGGWIPLGGVTMDGKVVTDGDRASLRSQAMKASIKSPLIRGFLKSMVRFVIGKNATYSPTVEDETTSKALNDNWLKWSRQVGMG